MIKVTAKYRAKDTENDLYLFNIEFQFSRTNSPCIVVEDITPTNPYTLRVVCLFGPLPKGAYKIAWQMSNGEKIFETHDELVAFLQLFQHKSQWDIFTIRDVGVIRGWKNIFDYVLYSEEFPKWEYEFISGNFKVD